MGQNHILCLLLVAFSVAVSAGKPAARPLLEEWLDQQTAAALPASAKPASAAAKYDELETEVACLSTLGFRNCRCIGCTDYCADGTGSCDSNLCCSKVYIETYFTCCKERLQGLYGYEREPPSIPAALSNYEIGDCEVSASTFGKVKEDVDPEVAGSIVSKIGTYSLKCAVKQGGELCGHPFCDSLVLTSYGTVYWVEDAVSNTSPPYPPFDNACENAMVAWAPIIFATPAAAEPSPRLKPKTPPKGTKAKKSNTDDVDFLDPETGLPSPWYKDIAMVFSGPLHITSRRFDVKHHEGTFEYAFWLGTENNQQIPATEAVGKYQVTAPDTFIFKLTKPHGSYDEKAV